ncbi:MAG: hypothetical protein WCE61_21980 [Candidatus Acidiferrum sp.]
MNAQTDEERRFGQLAGAAAILSGAAWVTWAVLNATYAGQIDTYPPVVDARLYKAGALLTVGWNLLLIPAVVALWQWLREKRTSLLLLYSVCGGLSLCFWAYGGATHGITPALETTYLWLSAVWWTGIGFELRSEAKALGYFTMVLGLFALLDGLFSFLEPMPAAIYALAAPKLPLALGWSFWMGAKLMTRSEERTAS